MLPVVWTRGVRDTLESLEQRVGVVLTHLGPADTQVTPGGAQCVTANESSMRAVTASARESERSQPGRDGFASVSNDTRPAEARAAHSSRAIDTRIACVELQEVISNRTRYSTKYR